MYQKVGKGRLRRRKITAPRLYIWSIHAAWILEWTGIWYLLRFSQMLQDSLDGDSHCRWTITWSIIWKQSKTLLRPGSGIFCNGQMKHLTLNPIKHVFQLLKHPKNKQEIKTVYIVQCTHLALTIHFFGHWTSSSWAQRLQSAQILYFRANEEKSDGGSEWKIRCAW